MPITFASGLTAAAKDSKHRRTPSELPLRGGSLLCACGNLHQPCDCLLLLYATPCKSQASGKKFIFTSKYILLDITKTALPKQSRRKSSSGLRLPASTSHLERCSCLAGRGPNSSSLFQPLAAVVAVALGELGVHRWACAARHAMLEQGSIISFLIICKGIAYFSPFCCLVKHLSFSIHESTFQPVLL